MSENKLAQPHTNEDLRRSLLVENTATSMAIYRAVEEMKQLARELLDAREEIDTLKIELAASEERERLYRGGEQSARAEAMEWQRRAEAAEARNYHE